MQESYTDTVTAKPAEELVGLWQGMVSYYGTLCRMEGWQHLRPLFEFVKQLSTASLSAEVIPSLIDDNLFLSRSPLENGDTRCARISIGCTEDGKIMLKEYEARSRDFRPVICRREDALHLLSKLVARL